MSNLRIQTGELVDPSEVDALTLARFGVTPSRVRAATALRSLGHELVARDAADPLLDEITVAVETLVRRLREAGRRDRSMESLVDVESGSWPAAPPCEGEVLSHFPDCVVSGSANPMGVAIEVRCEGDDAVARVVLGSAFEGAPGQAHGGVVAAVFDDVMGYQLSIVQVPALTGRLTVTYRAPTPIDVPLVFQARLEGRDDRKLQISATAHTAAGDLLAEAAATFVVVSLDRMLAHGERGGA